MFTLLTYRRTCIQNSKTQNSKSYAQNIHSSILRIRTLDIHTPSYPHITHTPRVYSLRKSWKKLKILCIFENRTADVHSPPYTHILVCLVYLHSKFIKIFTRNHIQYIYSTYRMHNCTYSIKRTSVSKFASNSLQILTIAVNELKLLYFRYVI